MSTAKRIYISLKGQATPQSIAIYRNLQQSTAIYSNLPQSTAIYRNLPVPITLPGTATAYTIIARKEGRKSTYMDIQTA